MNRYRILESVGSHVERVHSYADLEIHHPSKHGHERGRSYAEVDGQREEVLRRPTSEGHLMVSKDFVLTDESGATRVPVPSPTAGYVGRVDARAGLVAIYDRPGGELIAQIRHMDLAGSGLHVGQAVAYGQPLGLQSGFGGGNPHAYGTHTHIDFNTARLDAFKQYFADIDSGEIPLRPMTTVRTHARAQAHGATAGHAVRVPSRDAHVEAAQRTLDRLGYTGADGRPLAVDGIAGRHSHHAIRQFQRDHGLPETASLDATTKARIDVEGRTMASSTHPAHALYRESIDAVMRLDHSRGIPTGPHVVPLAAAVAAEAARSGLTHVHRVEVGTGGGHARAVEFRRGVDDVVTNRTSMPIEVPQALAQPLAVSSEHAAQAIAARRAPHEVRQREPTRAVP